MALNKVVDWLFDKHFNDDSMHFHRQMLVIAKDANKGLADIQGILECAPVAVRTCALTNRTINAQISKPTNLYKHILGQSYDMAIYDAIEEFRPSALLALAGTVTHQGCLIIIIPPFAQWPTQAVCKPPFYLTYGFEMRESRYIEHLALKLANNQQIAIWRNNELHLPEANAFRQESTESSTFWSEDQKRGFSKLQDFIDTKDKYAVIKAPRGRGKSSLLGLFSASQLVKGYRVLVTSTAKSSVEGLINTCLENVKVHANNSFKRQVSTDVSTIKWVAPDSPHLRDNDFDMLIIDEAASFPASQLLEICHDNNRVILSTTTDGYEGSGKGFDLKVIAELCKGNNVHSIELTQPLRWYKDDPVELFLSHNLLFNGYASGSATINSVGQTNCQLTQSDQLTEHQLTQILLLLNGAHYQTTPDDLMRLVDSPDIYFALLKTEAGEIIAASAINIEGGKKLADLANDISSGARRVKGHLSAQGLAYFSATPEFAKMNYWRINRIAVNSKLQGKGFGSQLLEYILLEAEKNNIDAVTSSFGATLPLLKFWKKNQFTLLKVGKKKNKASATGSALVIHSISGTNQKLIDKLSLLGYRDAQYDQVPQSILAEFANNQCTKHPLNEYYLGRWKQFCFEQRNFESLSSSIPWLFHQFNNAGFKLEYSSKQKILLTLELLRVSRRPDKKLLEDLRVMLKPCVDKL